MNGKYVWEEINRAGDYAGVRSIVLGSSGFIGRWVARLLCSQGAEVFLIVRNKVTSREIFSRYGIHGEIYEADLRNQSLIRNLLLDLRPCILFNLAGYGVDPAERDEETAYSLNTQLLTTICEAMSQIRDQAWRGQNIIHTGSALEYGEIGGNLREDSNPYPTTLYGRTKLAGTKNLAEGCKTHGIKGLTARLFTVYGPGEHGHRLLPSLMETARTGRSLPLTAGEQKRDFTYVEDVAVGLLRLGMAPARPGSIVNLATGVLTPVRRFVEIAAGMLQIPPEQMVFGALPTRREEMRHDPVTIERLKDLTGWVPPTKIPDGIRRTKVFIEQISGGVCDG